MAIAAIKENVISSIKKAAEIPAKEGILEGRNVHKLAYAGGRLLLTTALITLATFILQANRQADHHREIDFSGNIAMGVAVSMAFNWATLGQKS